MGSGSIRPWLVSGVLALGGCSVYDSRFDFEPRPVDVAAAKPGSEATAARILVTVQGVRRADSKAGTPACVEVGLRIDNTTPFPASFDPQSLILFSAGLDEFPVASASPDGVTQLPPGTFAIIQACF